MGRIIFNGRFLAQSTTGVQRYASELITAIDQLIENKIINTKEHQLEIITPKNSLNIPKLKHVKYTQKGFSRGHLWEQLELPLYLDNALLLNLCNTGPLMYPNQIVTIHDASIFDMPHAYSLLFRTWYKLLLNNLAKTARQIITDSAFSQASISRNCNIDKNKIKIIPLGKEHIINVKSNNSLLKKYDIGKKPFCVAISSMNTNKNFHTIVKAFQSLKDCNLELVLAGGTNNKIFRNSSIQLPENTKHIGSIPDETLKALYENALCLVYPSLYEGFGLPPLEAMACGCPVIVSDIAALIEVCATAALYCNANDPASLAENIRKLLTEPQTRSYLQQRGIERAKEFSWEKCAKEYMSIVMEEADNM